MGPSRWEGPLFNRLGSWLLAMDGFSRDMVGGHHTPAAHACPGARHTSNVLLLTVCACVLHSCG